VSFLSFAIKARDDLRAIGLTTDKDTVYQPQLGVVAHTCNPSYSGGRDQEDQGSKPALGR
jgi:hypothetical protein